MTDPLWLAGCYGHAPDFTLAALATVRRVWFKNSKRQRLKNFLVMNSEWRWTSKTIEPHGNIYRLFDKEIADSFNAEVGRHRHESASVKDVEKAREDLAKRIKASKRASLSNLRKARKV